jgi:hypothetical protein
MTLCRRWYWPFHRFRPCPWSEWFANWYEYDRCVHCGELREKM